MSKLPIKFDEKNRITNPSLHMAYHFEEVRLANTSEVTKTSSGGLVSNIPSLQLSLEGRTAIPAMSISINKVTSLFTLYTLHITRLFPGKVETALVFEGNHQTNENTEKLLLFIPLTKTTGQESIFKPLEQEITNNTKAPLDLNGLIPSNPFSYYKYFENGVVYHVVFFDKSELTYLLLPTIPTMEYPLDKIETLYLSSDIPIHRTTMNGAFEDNIYIDCVPVESLQKSKQYLKIDTGYSGFNPRRIVDLLVILSTVILLMCVIYFFYWVGIRITRSQASRAGEPLG